MRCKEEEGWWGWGGGGVLGRSSIIIDNQSFTSLILINRLQNWQSIKIGKGDT